MLTEENKSHPILFVLTTPVFTHKFSYILYDYSFSCQIFPDVPSSADHESNHLSIEINALE